MSDLIKPGPLSGYKCSSFGGAAKAKLRAAEAMGCVKAKGGKKQKLKSSDIVFFGGHHYARYDLPLVFDSMDLNEYKLDGGKVKLLLISSCAGLRKNARNGFKRKFPNAYIFGWIFSAPLDQKGIWPDFVGSITGPLDLTRQEDMNKLINKWKLFVEQKVQRKYAVVPRGLGYSTPQGAVSYYTRTKGTLWKWVTKDDNLN